MALTEFQRRVCRLLADERKRSGESYVAGGLALNELLAGHRRSKDIDLFHDAQAALAAALDVRLQRRKGGRCALARRNALRTVWTAFAPVDTGLQ